MTNIANNTISKLAAPAYTTINPYTIGSLPFPNNALAIDAFGDVWTTNQGPSGAVSEIFGVAAPAF